jgi:hypothetical protein
MSRFLEELIRRQATGHCEYCRVPEAYLKFQHVLDHIIARKHGGATELGNLALCCVACNQHKGSNLSGIDPQTSAIIPLFNPRRERWDEHFRYEGAILIGLTSTGRATVAALSINIPRRIIARRALLKEGAVF